MLAGIGFSILFIALDRAGTNSGAWPLLPGQAAAVILVLPFARGVKVPTTDRLSSATLIVVAGLLSGTANLLFLASTAFGDLAVVAVLAALYPAFTVLLARFILAERWSRLQVVGLLAAAAAIVLVGLG